MIFDAADPRQCSCAKHSSTHALQGLTVVGAGNLPVSGVRQDSGSGNFVTAC